MIDLSHGISLETPPFPGDPPVDIRVLDSTDQNPDPKQRHLNCSRLAMSVHCGTHLDAPYHFYGDRRTVDQLPLDVFVGPACMAKFTADVITPQHFEPYEANLRKTKRVILNSGWHHRWLEANYFSEHPVLTGETAEYLVRLGVVLIGVDFPSVDRPPHEAHLVLLGNDVVIVENLTNLDVIAGSLIRFTALPLKLMGRDGSPVRAVAEELNGL